MGIFARRTLVAKGAEEIKGKDIWLDNDDLRPLKLKDRTWTQVTYFTFWFSAAATVSNWYFLTQPSSYHMPCAHVRTGMAHPLLRHSVCPCGSRWHALSAASAL